MNNRYLLATFDHETDLLQATTAVRARGLRIVDAFTPYAVHGLDTAMGVRRSRLPWLCFVLGMVGGLGMLAFQHWTASVSWPIDVGGKPWNSLPSDVPVAFEAAVLLSGLGTVFALFVVSRLYPGKQPKLMDPRVTDDRFVLVIDQAEAICSTNELKSLLQQHNVVTTDEDLEAS